jgi:hypothetical protein
VGELVSERDPIAWAHSIQAEYERAEAEDDEFREENITNHDCHDHMVEEAPSPDRNGSLRITERCELCGKVLREYIDSVL